MIIDLNGVFFIDSNRRNWFIRSGLPREHRNRLPDDMEAMSEDIKGCYRELSAVIKVLGESRRYGKVRQDDLADAHAVCTEIDDASAAIEAAFATPLKLRQLKPLKIAFEVLHTDTHRGFRFKLNDPLNVHRQEWLAGKTQRWESGSYYQNLGYGLAETLLDGARMSDAGGRRACIELVRDFRAEILAIGPKLPKGYWGGDTRGPKTPFNCPIERLGAHPETRVGHR